MSCADCNNLSKNIYRYESMGLVPAYLIFWGDMTEVFECLLSVYIGRSRPQIITIYTWLDLERPLCSGSGL